MWLACVYDSGGMVCCVCLFRVVDGGLFAGWLVVFVFVTIWCCRIILSRAHLRSKIPKIGRWRLTDRNGRNKKETVSDDDDDDDDAALYMIRQLTPVECAQEKLRCIALP